MTIADMHYDFKMKLNKIDSQQYRNLRIPEIDWLLNEAQEQFIKLIAYPRSSKKLGVETSQRTIDDIRTLVTVSKIDIEETKSPNKDASKRILSLEGIPYLHFLRGEIITRRKGCNNTRLCRLRVVQHDDLDSESPFTCSNVEWREINGLFEGDAIILEMPRDQDKYEFTKGVITYIKRPAYMCLAKKFSPTGYRLPGGEVLLENQDCELPPQTHREIVDIAVMNASGQLQMSDYQIKLAKVKMNQYNE